MKKGKHDGGFRLITKRTRAEWTMEICLWLGGAVGLALGIMALERNPQEVPVRMRAGKGIVGWYMMCGMGGGFCVFMGLGRLWEYIGKRFRRKD